MKRAAKLFFLINVMSTISLSAMEEVDGATVLPVFYEDGIRKVLISEENVPGSPFYQTYEGWGGGFSPKEDKNALDTAAREFWEEALLQYTIGFTLEETKTYLQTKNVEAIIKVHAIPKFFPKKDEKRTKPIFIYIVKFERSDIEQIKKRFFQQLQSYNPPDEDNFKFREKGNLAVVEWSSLVQSIREPNLEIGSSVRALVYDKESSDVSPKERIIPLRSILVAVLYDHFLKYTDPVEDHKMHEYQCTIPNSE